MPEVSGWYSIVWDGMGREDVEAYETANHCAKVEDDPKPRDVATLELLGWVGHHDCALGRPENSCTAAEQQAGEDDIAQIMGVVEAEKRADVDAVS